MAQWMGSAVLAGTFMLALPVWANGNDASCPLPAFPANAPVDRSAALAAYEALPHDCLKQVFVACASEANAGLLDLGRAMVCSLGYEALLRQGFSGDFHALLAWWRSSRDDRQGAVPAP